MTASILALQLLDLPVPFKVVEQLPNKAREISPLHGFWI